MPFSNPMALRNQLRDKTLLQGKPQEFTLKPELIALTSLQWCRQTSKPVISGIARSKMIASEISLRMSFTASRPP
jgi:hypothetical protein